MGKVVRMEREMWGRIQKAVVRKVGGEKAEKASRRKKSESVSGARDSGEECGGGKGRESTVVSLLDLGFTREVIGDQSKERGESLPFEKGKRRKSLKEKEKGNHSQRGAFGVGMSSM